MKTGRAANEVGRSGINPEPQMQHREGDGAGMIVEEKRGKKINISTTWPLKPLPMTANIMKRYGSREGGRNEKDKKRTVK